MDKAPTNRERRRAMIAGGLEILELGILGVRMALLLMRQLGVVFSPAFRSLESALTWAFFAVICLWIIMGRNIDPRRYPVPVRIASGVLIALLLPVCLACIVLLLR